MTVISALSKLSTFSCENLHYNISVDEYLYICILPLKNSMLCFFYIFVVLIRLSVYIFYLSILPFYFVPSQLDINGYTAGIY